VTGLASSRQIPPHRIPACFRIFADRGLGEPARGALWAQVSEAGDRLAPAATHGIVSAAMSALRKLRRAVGLGQREFAALLSIPLETFRPLDSGRRVESVAVLQRARAAVAHHARRHELLPLQQLASEFHVHIRTLQAAVRTGRLTAHFSVQSVFGRPMRLATRAAAEAFMATHYGRFSGQAICPAPLPTVPNDYDQQLRGLRRRLGLTQAELARHIGAAGKLSLTTGLHSQ
jgi:transcriptional regulator with XRE-family HTH domain